jgi:hypothetical protein
MSQCIDFVLKNNEDIIKSIKNGSINTFDHSVMMKIIENPGYWEKILDKSSFDRIKEIIDIFTIYQRIDYTDTKTESSIIWRIREGFYLKNVNPGVGCESTQSI